MIHPLARQRFSFFFPFGVACLVIFFFSFAQTFAASSKHPLSKKEQQYLITSFQGLGFSQRYLKSVFYNERLHKDPRVMKIILPLPPNQEERTREEILRKRSIKKGKKPFKTWKQRQQRPSIYPQFLTPDSIQKAYLYSRNWRTLLAKASKKFKVDQEVIVSILLVETGFGSYLGKFNTMSVFTSIYLESQRSKRRKIEQKYRNDPKLKQRILKKLSKRSAWAKEQLHALLKIGKGGKIDIYELQGSYAGAFGIPQFLPSSYLRWGYDSDHNGSINLFLNPDSIYSTANFLRKHGWKSGLPHESNRKAIRSYNPSSPYINTVLQVAQMLSTYTKKAARHKKNNFKGATLAKR